MHNLNQFNLAYNASNVHAQSVLISPAEIGPLPDDLDHSIAYRAGCSFGYFCSEPRQISMLNYEGFGARVRGLLEEKRYRTLIVAARQTRDLIRQSVSPIMRNAENQIADRIAARTTTKSIGVSASTEVMEVVEDLLVAREMARVDLSVDLMMAQPQSPSKL
jgi:hypothetical protein